MINLEPINQIKLYGLDNYFLELVSLYKKNNFPNKLLLSGIKGSGKSTLAFHFINYVLSKDEKFNYSLKDFQINPENKSFKTIINKSNPNLNIIDVKIDKKSIDINQIRELITTLNKSSFNNKPRFVLVDNIEFLNINSINALLKFLEEPNYNVYFILIHNNKKVLPTLLSRCINYKISLSNKEVLEIANKILDGKLSENINKELVNYYLTPGNIYNLVKFAKLNDYDLSNFDLKDFLKTLIKENHFKKNILIKNIIFDLIEFYFTKISSSLSISIFEKYSLFLQRKSEITKYNLDEESLFIEFEEEILNG